MHRLFLTVLALFVLRSLGAAQCYVADPRYYSNGTDGRVQVARVVDLGSGPQLYIGGVFTRVGGKAAQNIARWNGTEWEALGGGTNADVYAICAYDSGSGPQLYIGGSFTKAGSVNVTGVARWDGSNWGPLGQGINNAIITTLAVHDEGAGPKLFVGGEFASINGISNGRRIGRWDGSAWSAVGFGADIGLSCMVSFDDGTGPALYIAGGMTAMGTNAVNDTPVNTVARWKNSAWSALGPGFNIPPQTMEVLNDGTGAAIYFGGGFSSAGGVPAARVAKWDSSGWSGVGFGLTDTVRGLAVYDDGFGPRLYACGSFAAFGYMVKLDAGQWYSIGQGGSGTVNSLVSHDDGSGPKLWAGGNFTRVQSTNARSIASWDGSSWHRASPGLGVQGRLRDIVAYDDGSGPALYATSDVNLVLAGDVPVGNTIRRQNGAWSTVGVGPKGTSFVQIPSGPMAGLYVVGNQVSGDPVMSGGVARWDGSAWSRVGPALVGGTFGVVDCGLYFDDGSGPALWVGGDFFDIGGISAFRCAKWNGTSWTAAGSNYGRILDLAAYDDGTGNALYAVMPSTPSVVKRVGGTWQPVANSPSVGAYCAIAYDDGTGSKLYVGTSGSARRWDGSTWETLDIPNIGIVTDFLVHDDGTGTALYVFGHRIVKWTSSGAVDVAVAFQSTGPSVEIAGSTVFDEGSGPTIHVAGEFDIVERMNSLHVASFRTCAASEAASFCYGDFSPGSNCPCGGQSAAWSGQGCPNSTGQGGVLSYGGVSSLSADTAALIGTRMPNGPALYFQGTVQLGGGNGATFGDGKRCVGGSVARLAVKLNSSGASQFPIPGDSPISMMGQVPGVGALHYQIWYRDSASFCTPSTFNLTNGITILWRP